VVHLRYHPLGVSARFCARSRYSDAPGITRKSSNAIATALATGQSRLLKELVHSTLPINQLARIAEQRRDHETRPTAGMNTSSDPAMMPSIDNGSVIRTKACHGLAAEIGGGFEQREVHLLEVE
jgi:hypothetical protein